MTCKITEYGFNNGFSGSFPMYSLPTLYLKLHSQKKKEAVAGSVKSFLGHSTILPFISSLSSVRDLENVRRNNLFSITH